MFAPIAATFHLLILLAVVAAAATLIVQLVRQARRSDDGSGAREFRSRAGELAALVACIVLVIWFTSGSMSSQVIAIAPMIIATVMMVASNIVDLTWPASAARVRVARLGERRQATPHRLRRTLFAAVGSLVALLGAGALTAAADGHSIEVSWGAGSAGAGPWPGWFYAAPMLAMLVVMLAVTWWSLRIIDGRPAAAPDGSGMDDASRQRSKVRVLRITTLGTTLTLVPVGFVMGTALNGIAQNLRMNASPLAMQPPIDWRQDLGFALMILALIALIGSLWVAGWRARPGATTRPERQSLGATQ